MASTLADDGGDHLRSHPRARRASPRTRPQWRRGRAAADAGVRRRLPVHKPGHRHRAPAGSPGRPRRRWRTRPDPGPVPVRKRRASGRARLLPGQSPTTAGRGPRRRRHPEPGRQPAQHAAQPRRRANPGWSRPLYLRSQHTRQPRSTDPVAAGRHRSDRHRARLCEVGPRARAGRHSATPDPARGAAGRIRARRRGT